MRQWYRMNDAEPNGVVEVSPSEASRWNALGYGIFWTVNAFKGPRRIENLDRILAWAVDLDAGTKAQQYARLQDGLIPSLVVETKRGYQAYWFAKDGKPQHWNAIVLERLVRFYGADKNARDLARIMRVPGFWHLKNPAEPFKIREVWSHNVAYTEEQIAGYYPADKAADDKRKFEAGKREVAEHDEFWDRVWHLDCERALTQLSGTRHVRGETYGFRKTRSGTRNLFVDGKGTSCWIDREGRIGSLSNGGPTVYQWLRWFGHLPGEATAIIKREFPEVTK